MINEFQKLENNISFFIKMNEMNGKKNYFWRQII